MARRSRGSREWGRAFWSERRERVQEARQRRAARGNDATWWIAKAERLIGAKIDAPEPVVATGRHPAKSVWGRAWCEHLEKYSDFSNRLPRGRTYLRSGFVLHLAIEPGLVRAVVEGTEL